MELDRLEAAVIEYYQSWANPDLPDRRRAELRETADVRLWTDAKKLIAAARERDALREQLATSQRNFKTVSLQRDNAAAQKKFAEAERDEMQERVEALRDAAEVAYGRMLYSKQVVDAWHCLGDALEADGRAATSAPDNSTNRETR